MHLFGAAAQGFKAAVQEYPSHLRFLPCLGFDDNGEADLTSVLPPLPMPPVSNKRVPILIDIYADVHWHAVG